MPFEVEMDDRIPDLIYVKLKQRSAPGEWDEASQIIRAILKENPDTVYNILVDDPGAITALKDGIVKMRQEMKDVLPNVDKLVMVSQSQYTHFLTGAVRKLVKISAGVSMYSVYSLEQAYRILEKDRVPGFRGSD